MHRSIHGEKSVCSMPGGGEELGLKQEGASRGQQMPVIMPRHI